YFTVKRIPLGILKTETNKDSSYVFVGYNNALLDHEQHKAVIPSYGFKDLDDQAQKMYEAEGYTVLPVDNIEGLVRKSGPHCTYLEMRQSLATDLDGGYYN
ncbi:MAG: hypothetical protein WC254_05690, partial [Candidatus Woesearchaeota archaeon]